MKKYDKWIALFSQTGTELYEVCDQLGRYPDVIITNKQEWDGINEGLVGRAPILFTEKKPSIEEYRKLFGVNPIVTLHGWLRIIPPEICNEYTIYNGHPGLITKYPELKGKDPQQRAYDAKMKTAGCVLHRAIAEVDAGEIISSAEINIQNTSLYDVFVLLKAESIKLWVEFLRKNL